MPARDSYPDGAPCWADVTSADAATTGAFYRDVFGWDLADMGEEYGHYTVATLGGKMVAAITPPPPGGAEPLAGWNVYLRSGDAAASGNAIEKAGGTLVMQPMEVPGQGTMLMAADPTGAVFGAWQPGGHNGAELFAEDGAMVWAEVHSPDGKAADAFYTTAFPLTAEPVEGMDTRYSTPRATWSADGRRCPESRRTGWCTSRSPTPTPPRRRSPRSAVRSSCRPRTPRTGGSRSSATRPATHSRSSSHRSNDGCSGPAYPREAGSRPARLHEADGMQARDR